MKPRAHTKAILVFILPFILVWMTYFLTAFSFSAREVFQTSMFWGLSVMYWMAMLMIAPLWLANDES